MIKLDLNELLRDKIGTSTLLQIIFVAFFFLSPGLMALAYLDKELLIELGELKLAVLSFGLSVLLIILAGLAAVSPRSLYIAFTQNPAAINRNILSIGTLIWAYLFVLIIPALNYFIVKMFPLLGEFSDNTQLGFTYLILLFFCIFVFVKQMLAMLKEVRMTNG
ncbi:hypothetical protein [Thiomicrorhabdus sp.]|uniref:hypothetical protein n=1 Tax=Thiomicrorhabdus sp. TaxID=2039724 RepID=UPI0035627115